MLALVNEARTNFEYPLTVSYTYNRRPYSRTLPNMVEFNRNTHVISFPSLRELWWICREIWLGKSIGRSLMNLKLRDVTLSGEVLDLGAGGHVASYYRFMHIDSKCHITRTDYYKRGKNVLKLDLDKQFKLTSNYDTVLCFNVLEHMKDPVHVISESKKVLRKNGRMICSTPFFYMLHHDPKDYWRFTHESVEVLAEKAGMKVDEVVSVGLGPFTAGCHIINELIPKLVRPVFFLTSFCLDLLLVKYSPFHKGKYPLHYFYILSGN